LKTLGERLNHLVRVRKLNNARLAKLCGVSRQSVIHWRTPKFKRMDAEVALTICDELKISLPWLVRGVGEMEGIDTTDVDIERLTESIHLIETHLADTAGRLTPEKKARATSIVYQLLSQSAGGNAEPAVIKNVLRLVA